MASLGPGTLDISVLASASGIEEIIIIKKLYRVCPQKRVVPSEKVSLIWLKQVSPPDQPGMLLIRVPIWTARLFTEFGINMIVFTVTNTVEYTSASNLQL